MRNKLITLSILIFLLITFFAAFLSFTRKTEDWEFIQKVGGIKTGVPLDTEDGFYLPVLCNVSGTDSITIKPTTMNSALSCIKIKSVIKDKDIHLRVITGIFFSKRNYCNCKAIKIGHLKSGNYTIYYGSSFDHPIGKFTIQ